ncbi:PAS domain S-box protein [Natronorubrum sp. JWXQ-INN-674]|uniref:histidine kinase n=1 Tax=Natronorubrum halalkaliphilum TaxID=2691917 RepID=A0A6B0VS45_9EURY|nr:PAS domain-containing sensor histidine kinase [Natronorubrum halalkaliphilum]MXV63877.1 PAS domain S-box protein [Natronorubrum halalkaliphilum]
MADSEQANSPELPLEEYRMLVECSNDIATITKPNGEITYVSPSVRRVLGYEPEELIGEIGYDYQHPSDCERTAEAFEALEADPETPQAVETRFRRADGSWCWIEATIRKYPGTDDGQRILVNSRDVTGRKRRDEEMQTLAREYRTLLENVQDAIFLVGVEHSERDVEFRFERLSPSYESTTGLTTEEFKGKTPREVFGEEVGAEVEANYRRCVERCEPITYQEELPMPEGTIAWQTKLAPVGVSGEVSQIIGIARNITELRDHEQQLTEQRDNLDILNQVLRHDIRNELQLVTAYANTIADRVEGDDLTYVETIQESAERAVKLTETARDMSEVMLTDTSNLREVDLQIVLNRVLRDVRSTHSDVIITEEGSVPSDTVLANDMLDSVFHNLLTNAVHHNDQDVPEVSVTASEREDSIVVRVADNGPGVPDSQKETVFGKGERGLDSPGTGLGLYLVESLVDIYGGDVWIEDNEPHGAIFVVELRKVQ